MQVGSPPPCSPSVLPSILLCEVPAPCWVALHTPGTPGTSPLLTFVGTRHPLQWGHVVVVLPDGEGEDAHLRHSEAVSSPEDMGAAQGTLWGSLGSPGSAQPRPHTLGCAPTGVGAQGAHQPHPSPRTKVGAGSGAAAAPLRGQWLGAGAGGLGK